MVDVHPILVLFITTDQGTSDAGVIPPASDECERAAAAGKPIVLADPESLYSTSVRDLAAGLLPLPVAATASLIAHR